MSFAVVAMVAFLFFLYALPLVLVGVPIVWYHRSVAWEWWESPLLVAPFCLWFGLTLAHDTGKSLGNAVVEPFLCGCIACAPILAKTVASRLGWRTQRSCVTAFLVSCAAIVAVWLGMPTLQE